VRTKRRRRKGVVFCLSMAGLDMESRRSGDAIIPQSGVWILFLAKSEAAFQQTKTQSGWVAVPLIKSRARRRRCSGDFKVPTFLTIVLTDEHKSS
jgi:hypothetical protein